MSCRVRFSVLCLQRQSVALDARSFLHCKRLHSQPDRLAPTIHAYRHKQNTQKNKIKLMFVLCVFGVHGVMHILELLDDILEYHC